MKKLIALTAILAITVIAFSMPAHATKPGNNGGGNGGCGVGQTTNGCGGTTTPPVTGATNNGGAGGAGGDAAAGALSLSGAAAGSDAQAISGGNTQGVAVEGDRTESNTPPVIAGNIPSVPTSCRLYLFGGAATRDGAGSGTMPIGNDQTCLSIAKLNLMERTGGFTQSEKQMVACKVEGMAELETCKKLGAKEYGREEAESRNHY